jgi:cell wall-associated NlpC family hydrolase
MGIRQIGAGAGAVGVVAVAAVLAFGGGGHVQAHDRKTALIATTGQSSAVDPAKRHTADPAYADPRPGGTRTGTGDANRGTSSAGANHSTSPGGAEAGPRGGAAHQRLGAAGNRDNVAAEAPDPEEAKSFPVSGTIHHAVAATPHTAAEEVVAPGAPSDAEVQAELHQMHAVQQAARKRETATMSTVPGGDSVGGSGAIPIPQDIPEVVQRVIAGANAIADFPYVYGGGHASFVSNSYDCSGSVSYALAAGGLLGAPETSGQLESWGEPGPGKWITIYANAGHVYMYVNVGGRWMRFDTVGRSGPYASRWQPEIRSNEGFVARHPPGL